MSFGFLNTAYFSTIEYSSPNETQDIMMYKKRNYDCANNGLQNSYSFQLRHLRPYQPINYALVAHPSRKDLVNFALTH